MRFASHSPNGRAQPRVNSWVLGAPADEGVPMIFGSNTHEPGVNLGKSKALAFTISPNVSGALTTLSI
jgi:hypothetical protein